MLTLHSEKVREQLLDLAWSLWTGLGVPGLIDNHQNNAIDPEPLIIFTAALGDSDPRLRDEVTDWCIRYGNFISGARLKNLLVDAEDTTVSAYGELAATVAEHSSVRWPLRTTGREHIVRERHRIQSFDRASQFVLRLRGLLGVGARAEIISVFLANPAIALGAADLAAKTNYTKRNIAQVLDTLRMGGVLEGFLVRNQIHFRMPSERRKQLSKQLVPMPKAFLHWPSLLHIMTTVLDSMVKFESKSPTVRGVEVGSVLRKLNDTIGTAQLPTPNYDVRGPDLWQEFCDWTDTTVKSLVSGNI